MNEILEADTVGWYAIFVEARQEEKFQEFVNKVYPDENIETLVPKRKLLERRQGKYYERILKLFPGYVLINTDMDEVDMYYKLNASPSVISVLKNDGYPVTVPDEEMEIILALTRYGEVIDFSNIYKEGDRIKVVSGPLMGLEGIVKKYDHRKMRAKVVLDFLDKQRKVDLGAQMITKRS